MGVAVAPSGDLIAALTTFRRARRRKRLEDIHWVDALYHTYTTALLAGAAVLLISNAVGDKAVTGAGLNEVRDNGPALLGLVVAAVIAVGLRSGGRGGPLALERPEVRHVLLAPVDRSVALRGPAIRQARFAVFVGMVVGATAGHLTARRLPGSDVAWTANGALFGAVAVALAYGAALVASGLRLPRWLLTATWVAMAGWAIGDVLAEVETGLVSGVPPSPTSFVARQALWPLRFDALGLVGLAAVPVLAVAGFGRLGHLSIEAAERRSVLVGQLRFAATLQDIRTVLVLRRQLAMELPRVRPWLRLVARGHDRFPIWSRGWRGLLRWPATRAGRAVLLAAVAGLAGRWAWEGTTPLVVVSGLALFVAALDAVEPLAQEIDHPSRRDSLPVEAGFIYLRHLPLAAVTMLGVAAIGAAIAVAVRPSVSALGVAGAAVAPAALGAASGAVVSVLMGAPSLQQASLFITPEVAGLKLVVRTAWPPVLAVTGVAPIVIARSVEGAGPPPAAMVALTGVGVAVLFVLICGWVRLRDQIKAWWSAQLEQAFPPRDTSEGVRG